MVRHIYMSLGFKRLMKRESCRRIFEKYTDTKFLENPSTESGVVSCGRTDGQADRQTDRHDEAASRFSQSCEKRLKTRLLDDDKLMKWKLRIVSDQFVMQREYKCVNFLVLSVSFIYLRSI